MVNKEGFKNFQAAIQNAVKKPCPYCGGNSLGQTSQLLKMEVGEQVFGEPRGSRDRDAHPDHPFDNPREFRALVCLDCGYAILFQMFPH